MKDTIRLPKKAVAAIQKWSKWNKKTAPRSKTVFVNYSHADGRPQLMFGYGHAPTSLAGGDGEVAGFGLRSDWLHGNSPERSYLVLAFNNDWQGPQLADALGGEFYLLEKESEIPKLLRRAHKKALR